MLCPRIRYGLLSLVVIGIGMFAGTSQAALLGLTRESPDLTSQPVTVAFDAGTGEFRVEGSIISGFDLDNVAPPDYTMADFGGVMNYEISVFLDNLGNPLSGSLLVEGTLAAEGANSGTLLTGIISDFGFQDIGPFDPVSLFEFVFTTTGGDLRALYFPVQAQVILTAFDDNTTYNGTFTSDFSFLGQISQTDTFAPQVPEPAAGLLLLLGMALSARRIRRMRRVSEQIC